jgi:RHS repeat-associated protein
MLSRLSGGAIRGALAMRTLLALATVLTVVALTLTSSVANAVPVSPEPSIEPSPGEVDPSLPEPVEPSPEPPAEPDENDQPPTDGGLSDALDGFGDIAPEDQPVVVSSEDQGPEIPDQEAHTGAPEPVVPIERTRETLIVDGANGENVVQGLTSVSLSEVVESADALSGVDVPADTALRGDLIVDDLPRAVSGDEVDVDTIPLTEGQIPGAAFAVRLTATDPDADARWMGINLDISTVRYAFGGDFGGRLQLMVFPECILTSPEDPSCTVGIPLADANIDGDTLTGVVPADAGDGVRLEGAMGMAGFRSTAVRATDLFTGLAGSRSFPMATTSQGTIVAAVSGAAGPGGTFAKTDLAPVGSWAVAEQSGAFTYQVPLEVPPVTAGPVPNVALGYNSQILDGHTPASNGQSSWIADGWDMQFGYIERIYNSCTAEGVTSASVTLSTAFPSTTKLYSAGKWNNDSYNDLLALSSAGELRLHLGQPGGTFFTPGVVLGWGWNVLTAIVAPGDFDGDGNVDILARSSDGNLWLYRGDGDEGFIGGGATLVSGGWNTFVEIVAPGDFTGDTEPDLIGRDTLGNLKLYIGDGVGGWAVQNQQLGQGFQVFSKILTPGDFSGDTKVDIIGVYPGGSAEMFKGNGTGGWISGAGFPVAGPWSSASTFVAFNDLNADGLSDLVGRGGAGELILWPGNGAGGGIMNRGNDLCWASAFDATIDVDGDPVTLTAAERASYVMSLGGATYELFPQGDNVFKTSPDSGIVVERVSNGTYNNGDNNNEYFRVWTPDGGVAYFGYGTSGSTATNSVATVQHWANDGGPSCLGTCQQAYRWMLDIQVDSTKNAMFYTYEKETNRYAQSGATIFNLYTSAIYPDTIEYGGRFTGTWDAPIVTETQARVEFIRTGRCVENTLADHSLTDADGSVIEGCVEPNTKAASFPDVPADLICPVPEDPPTDPPTPNCNVTTQRTPAFFKQQRLARVDTYVKTGNDWAPVARHTLYSTYPLPASAAGRTLWLDGVFTRYLGSESGDEPSLDDLTTYAITFDGTLLNNRVDWLTDAGKLEKRRLTGIRNEMGGYVKVKYDRAFDPAASGGACPQASRSTATPKDGLAATWYRANSWECFRAKGSDGLYGLYHRYLVSSIDLEDLVGGQPKQTFTYTYENNYVDVSGVPTPQPLWAYADSILEVRDAANVDKQEFSTFLGYPKVTVSTGTEGVEGAVGTKSSTMTYYHQGRTGTWDGTTANLATGVDVDLMLPSWYEDSDDLGALRGMPALVLALDSEDRIIGQTYYDYDVEITADGPYQHDATVVQTSNVFNTRGVYVGGVVQERTSSTATTYHQDYPWIAIGTESVPNTELASKEDNVSTSSIQYTFDSEDYEDFSEWNHADPAPFFHLPISGDSHFQVEAAAPTILTGQWETCYLETDAQVECLLTNAAMRGLPTIERQRVTNGTDDDAWLKSTATYDALGRIVSAKGPAETENSTQVSWDYTDDNPSDGFSHVKVTNQALWETHQWSEPAFGNVVKTQDANGDFTHYKYDAGGLLTAGWANRPGLDLTTDAPAANVAPTVYYGYDVYGPALSIRTTPVAVVSAQFAGLDTAGLPVVLPAASTVRRSYEFLDGFGRVIESHTVAPDGTGGRLVTQVAFDDVGRVVRSSEPFYDAEPAQVDSGLMDGTWPTIPRFTETTYDESGRVDTTTMKVIINTVQTSVPLSDADYGLDWSVSKSPATQAYTKVFTDVLGRTTLQQQFPDANPLSVPIQTEYDYAITASGSTVTVIDDDEQETIFTSDLGGRRIGLTDPNSGASSYTYNESGQVAQIVSAAGTVSLTYDPLGRMRTRTTTDSASNVSSSASWTYSEAEGTLGLLVSENATTVTPVGSFPVTKTFTYDTQNRLVGSKLTLPQTTLLGELSGEGYGTTISYDATGAAKAVTHDAVGGLPEETVTTKLDPLGRARELTINVTGQSTKTLVDSTEFDKLGRLKTRTYGNGVERGYTWNQKWGSLYILTASYDEGTELVQKDTYLRDTSGRVTSIKDEVVGITQCHAYDGHNRLDMAWTDIRTNACAGGYGDATQPLDPDSRVPLAYAVDYDYWSTGQIHTIEDLLHDVDSTYHYDDALNPNGELPNAVKAVDSTERVNDVAVPTTDTFTYDAAGRMITRTIDVPESVGPDAQLNLTWDASSNLVATSGQGDNIVYLYDAGGQRVAQVKVSELTTSADPVSATVYLGATEVTDPNTATEGPLDATRFYTFGGATVATATSTAGAAPVWSLLLGDIQGSAQVMMDLVPDAGEDNGFEPASSSHTVTRDAYLPYGATRGDSDLTIDRGWLGQVEDTTTGLTYLNARYYDPLLGRFLSPDPLMNPGDPKTLDPYMYAANNPVTFSDASGLCYNLSDAQMAACAQRTGATTVYQRASQAIARGSNLFTRGQQLIRSARRSIAVLNANVGRALQISQIEFGAARGLAASQESWSDTARRLGNAGRNGHLNMYGGAFNTVASTVNGAFGASPVGMGLAAEGVNAQIPTVGIVGNYDEQRWSSYTGSAMVEGAAFVGTGGVGSLRSLVTGTAKLFTGARSGNAFSGLRSMPRACYTSFSASTKVLMADGSYKPISAIVVGDMVMAHDPETGEKGAREVTHVWVHQDALVNLELDGETVTTTSDHPFWNATDAQWQDAGVLDAGDMVLTSTGDLIPVAGLLQNSWHMGTAYNLTVDDIHTYYVQAADADVLVHNCGSGLNNASQGLRQLFADGSIRNRTIIGIRETLLDNGFSQGLTNNRQGYLFTNGTGEHVRVMHRSGGWDVRVMNSAGNYLDDVGNVGSNSATHGIPVRSS